MSLTDEVMRLLLRIYSFSRLRILRVRGLRGLQIEYAHRVWHMYLRL